MSSPQQLWCLYQKVEGYEVRGLDSAMLRAALHAIPPRQYHLWLIWDSFGKTWLSLSDYPDLKPSRLHSIHHEITKPRIDPEDLGQRLDADKGVVKKIDEWTSKSFIEDLALDKTQKAKSGPRRMRHHFDVVIKSGSNRFETVTEEISLKEMKLKDPLPTWVGVHFKVRLRRGENELTLVCTRLRASDMHQIVILKASSVALYRQWLISS